MAYLGASDLLAVVASCTLAALLASRFGWNIRIPFVGLGARVVTPGVVVVWMAALSLWGTRDSRLVFAGTEYYTRQFRATLAAFGIVGLGGFIASVSAARPFVLFALPVGLVVLTSSRWLVRQWVGRNYPLRRAVYLGEGAHHDLKLLEADAPLRVETVGLVSGPTAEEVMRQVEQMDAAILVIGTDHGLAMSELRSLMWMLDQSRVEVWFAAATPFLRAGKAFLVPSARASMLVVDPVHLTTGQRVVKRLFDLVVGVVFVLLLAPVALLGALIVLVSDGRPVFYSQQRVGLNGELFTIRKIRTMRRGEGSSMQVSRSIKDPLDPRITAVGRVLRRWSIDEIPQFLNVIGGSMSIVGPRPRLECEVSGSLQSTRRLNAKPGLTGVWQTSGRSLVPLDEAEVMDINYVDGWSLFGDVALVVRTVKVVIAGKGAF
jgi:lipopolysaccharide/colanic/teichoic acid biosynthesis glycosyltransferase